MSRTLALRGGPGARTCRPGSRGNRASRKRPGSSSRELGGRLLPQLSARRADVLTLAPAHGGGDTRTQQDRLERQDSRERWTAEAGPLPVVERDQVHLGANPAQEADEPPGVLEGVIDLVEQHVLEEDPSPRRQWK